MQSCVVVCKALSPVEVSAVIVTAWLVDAHVLVLVPVRSRLHAVRLEVETFSLTCVRNSTNCSLRNIRSATEYRSPYHVGPVTYQRTKNVAACCVTCAIFHGIVTPSGDN